MSDKTIRILDHEITRRDALKAGGIAGLGLAFAAPVVRSVKPQRAFAQSYGSALFCKYEVPSGRVGSAAGCADIEPGAVLCLPCPQGPCYDSTPGSADNPSFNATIVTIGQCEYPIASVALLEANCVECPPGAIVVDAVVDAGT